MDRLPQVAAGQSPFAVVVGCSDSRVPPEILFDRGIGDLFIVRTAGHVLDSAALASVVYAVEELATPLVLVLGHTQCGAVHAALEDGNAPEYLRSVVRAIRRSLDAADHLSGSRWDNVARVHVARTAERIRATLATEATSLHASSVRVVGAMYDTSTGEVTLLPDEVVQLVQDASESAASSETPSHTSREPIAAPDREEEPGGSETEQIVPQPVHTESSANAMAPRITRWCPKCRTGYPDELAFCTRCGVLLVEPTFAVACLRCRKPNQIGSDRCHACGADLHPAWLASGGRKPRPPVVLDTRQGGGNRTGCTTSATLILFGAGALTLLALRVLGL
jgi:carbonic anhydrase